MGQKQKLMTTTTTQPVTNQTHMHLSLKTVNGMATEKLSALFVHTSH